VLSIVKLGMRRRRPESREACYHDEGMELAQTTKKSSEACYNVEGMELAKTTNSLPHRTCR
jgi:hypothetical protein